VARRPFDSAALTEAGAHLVLDDLSEFPAWGAAYPAEPA
jgi:hypothetical protein